MKIDKNGFSTIFFYFCLILKELFSKLGDKPQIIKQTEILISIPSLFYYHGKSIKTRYSCELTLANIHKVISTTSYHRHHGHGYAT